MSEDRFMAVFQHWYNELYCSVMDACTLYGVNYMEMLKWISAEPVRHQKFLEITEFKLCRVREELNAKPKG